MSKSSRFILTEQELLQSEVSALTEREVFCLEAYLVNGDKYKAYIYSREGSLSANIGALRDASERFFKSDKVRAFLRLNKKRVAVGDKVSSSSSGGGRLLGNGSREDKLDSYVRGLEMIAETGSANEQVSAYKALADIQQLKKIDMTEADERKVLFYLPLRCRDCVLYKKSADALDSDFELSNC